VHLPRWAGVLLEAAQQILVGLLEKQGSPFMSVFAVAFSAEAALEGGKSKRQPPVFVGSFRDVQTMEQRLSQAQAAGASVLTAVHWQTLPSFVLRVVDREAAGVMPEDQDSTRLFRRVGFDTHSPLTHHPLLTTHCSLTLLTTHCTLLTTRHARRSGLDAPLSLSWV